ncbi:hypothetical protein ACOI8A_05465 [Pseudomonas sp. P4795]|uniref:hypothetical protein n=1 Tax=Pseudomonas sp. P4795 TaxID=3409915 RepID=UPI003B5A9FF7
MSHNFKPGDLALTLIAAYGFAAMTEVTIEVFLHKGQIAQEPCGDLFTAPFDGWVVYRLPWPGSGFFRAKHLMPLRGDFTPEQQKAKEAV